jgi:hypothetical protein
MLMSKDTPEVGDVWEYKYGFDKLHIIETDLPNGYVRVLKKITGKYLQQREYTLEFFNDCRFLGHSKANIDDLFKTENEE